MTRPRTSSANPFWRRIHHAWQALTGHERYKSNLTCFVDFDGKRIKQVRFPDSFEARRIEAILCATRESGLFPAFVFGLENTLWVDFVGGVAVDASNPAHRSAVADFFARLYRHGPRRMEIAGTDLHPRLLTNLETLRTAGVLDAGRADRLGELAAETRPGMVWLGLEYIDPLRKNFVITDSGAVGIDIEAVRADQLLGIGLAKARLRWLEVPAGELLSRITEKGAPDLSGQYAYAELSFLVHYAVQSLFRGKPRRVPVAAFDALIEKA